MLDLQNRAWYLPHLQRTGRHGPVRVVHAVERDRETGLMMATRRDFLKVSAALAAAGPLALGGRQASAAREKELNILCWEGYNSAEVLDPFRRAYDATVKAESLTNDPTMMNRLRAGETGVWDLINVNNPWARKVMLP